MKQYSYGDDLTITEDVIKKAAKLAIKTVHDNLPENARRIDVITHVLKVSNDELQQMKIEL